MSVMDRDEDFTTPGPRCRVRGCMEETCDPALLMCFDHVGKDALLLLVYRLREKNTRTSKE
jgi:hypothetical protein